MGARFLASGSGPAVRGLAQATWAAAVTLDRARESLPRGRSLMSHRLRLADMIAALASLALETDTEATSRAMRESNG